MPMDNGQYMDNSINYSMNITGKSGLSLQIMANGYGITSEAEADQEFQSLLDYLYQWPDRNTAIPPTCQKFVNWLYQLTSEHEPVEEIPPPADPPTEDPEEPPAG